MRIKTIYISFVLLLAFTTACTSHVDDIRYEGEDFVLFADSDYVMPLTEDNRVFEIPVGFATSAPYDRTVAVAVDVKQSNAIEDYHFLVENHNVKVAAGQTTGMLRLRGCYNHVESVDDSLCVTLRLLPHEGQTPTQQNQSSASLHGTSALYGSTTRVHLQKVRPFRIEDYVGDLRLTCTFPFSTSSVTNFNVKSEKINDSTLVVRKPFDDNRDLVLNFHTGKSNPFDQNIDMREQVAFTDATFGQVSMATVEGAPSYYLPEDRAFVLYLNAYLSHLGSFGSYYYIFQWISPDQALADKN